MFRSVLLGDDFVEDSKMLTRSPNQTVLYKMRYHTYLL